VPDDFVFRLLDPAWEHFAPTMELAVGRVPALADVGINRLVNGPESFTPDGMFILGEAPELRNCFIGAGFNAFGIAAGGGAGMALAEWVVNGAPPYDLWQADIRRFGRPHRSVEWVRTRTLEAYAKHYTMAWPFEEHDSGRPCRRSPLYDRLLQQGACFGEKLGWERPNWFADIGARAAAPFHSYGRQNSSRLSSEHAAMREQAGLIDQTSFAGFALRAQDRCPPSVAVRQRRRQAGRGGDMQMLDSRRRRVT
jgi:4-methylaminobutanoate oxidase (formaldehyde-forming)